jgi:hypothetical protein
MTKALVLRERPQPLGEVAANSISHSTGQLAALPGDAIAWPLFFLFCLSLSATGMTISPVYVSLLIQ